MHLNTLRCKDKELIDMKSTEHDINKLIDINLRLICKNNSKEEYYTSFKDENGNQIDHLDLDPMTVALEMEENGLIWMSGENCKLKAFGQDVCINGGWIKHLELEKAMREKEENRPVKNNTTNIYGNNKGIVNQDFDLFNNPSPINTSAAPNSNPETKSLFKRIYSDPWLIGISLAIIALILSADRIKNWINEIIDKI